MNLVILLRDGNFIGIKVNFATIEKKEIFAEFDDGNNFKLLLDGIEKAYVDGIKVYPR